MGAELSSMQQRIGSTPTTKPPGPVVARRTSVHPAESNHIMMAPAPAGQVLTVHSQTKWNAHFEASKTHDHKLMVINFTASWCAPCHNMNTIISEFATTYATDVEFVKIDVDELMHVAMEFEVQALPTFILMKKGKIMDRVTGAKKEELQTKIDRNRRVLHY